MVGKRIVILIASLALAIGLMPASALAAQNTAGLSAGNSGLTTQSENIYLTGPDKSDINIVGMPVTVTAYTSIYFYQYGYAVANFITFKITKNGKIVYYGHDTYSSAGS
ncbi:MAG: hypothetical protein J5818_04325, partial [Eggerthellaceae bacterium]|nr:hypothetical protein [Eggerthellaceae bacterium]